MKSIFLKVCLIFFFASAGLIVAQVDTVYLNEDQDNLGLEPAPTLSYGESLMFVSNGGDFAILIYHANEFFNIDADTIDIRVTESTPSSAYNVLKQKYTKTIYYYVYSYGNDEWPDAPPRIIIHAHE